MTFEQVGNMTPGQARMLSDGYGAVDGHREVAETLVKIVNSLFGGESEGGQVKPSPPAPNDDEAGMGVMIPELQAVVDQLAERKAVHEAVHEAGWLEST